MPSATLPKASLPIFDFSKFLKGDSKESIEEAKRIVDAFKTFGFVYLVNHGISNERIQSLFSWSKRFFYLPEEVRMRPDVLRPEQTTGNTSFVARGYSPTGREKLSQVFDDGGLKNLRAVPDVKDMFEIGPEKGVALEREGNRFPPKEAIPGFEEFTAGFYWEAQALGLHILRCIAIGLKLDENYFASYHQEADNLFRLIRYPPIERASMRSGKNARTNAHTDYGSITILFQDNVGGLEVEDPANPGTYISATPVEGAVIVNIADFLMMWSNDTLKSNVHRVVEPPAERELPDGMELTQERFSVPYFIQADRNKVVKCAKELEGSETKYEPVSAGEYLSKRVTATFKKY